MDDEIPPVVAPKQKDAPKEEPADNSPLKPAPSQPARGTPSTSKTSKGKRKLNEETKPSVAPPKKVKTENVCHYLHELAFVEPFTFYFLEGERAYLIIPKPWITLKKCIID